MNEVIDPCAGVSFGIELPTLKCTDSIIPDFGNLTDFGRGLGSLPGQLSRMAFCAAEDVAKKIQAAIDKLLELFDSIFGDSPWSASSPLFSNLKMPEFEMEIKLRALFTEFKIYLMMKLLDILKKIIGPILQIPIPFLKDCVIGDLLTAEGRAKIRKTIEDDIDAISNALGLPWEFDFSGDLTLGNIEMRVQSIFTRILIKIEETLTNLLFSAINILLQPIKKILEGLGLILPTLQSILDAFDFEKMFDNIWQSVKDLAISVQEKMQKIIDFFLELDIMSILESILGKFLEPFRQIWNLFAKGFRNLRDLLNLSDKEWNLESPDIKFDRIMTAVKDFFSKMATFIMEVFLQAIKQAIELIKKLALHAIDSIIAVLNQILDFIPFTFCKFLHLVAAPLLGLGDLVKGLLPSEISVTSFIPTLALPAPA